MAKFCKNCGNELGEGAQVCLKCGIMTDEAKQKSNTSSGNGQPKSKMAAGLLGIFLGSVGAHNFYLGYTGKAVAQLILTPVTCGIAGIWGFIEGILILTGSINKDAQGNPLSD